MSVNREGGGRREGKTERGRGRGRGRGRERKRKGKRKKAVLGRKQ